MELTSIGCTEHMSERNHLIRGQREEQPQTRTQGERGGRATGSIDLVNGSSVQ